MEPFQKIYFPNLNGLRFIAAFMVIIHHLEQVLYVFGHDNNWNNPIIFLIGGLGVELFFVLSGFLITYLLLTEEKNTKQISIKDFYIRRVLRIWPLYYFLVVLAFFVFPHINAFQIPTYSEQLASHYWQALILFVLFLPNLALSGYGLVVPYASQAWSVGVEEQFYLIWPILMKFFKNKLNVLLSVILLYLLMKFLGFRFIERFLFWNHWLDLFNSFWFSFKIDCMAIGGVFSYILFSKHKILNLLFHKYVFALSLLTVVILISFSVGIPYIQQEVYAVFFGIIILNLATNNNGGLILENKIFNYLGKISYGLYMYHVIAIVICIQLFNFFGILNYHIFLLLTCLSVTILLASISYKFIEKRFISLKTKYSKVISGDNAK